MYQNFWNYLLDALFQLVIWLCEAILSKVQISTIDFDNMFVASITMIFQMAWVALSTFDLTIVGTALAISLALWSFRVQAKIAALIGTILRMISILGGFI